MRRLHRQSLRGALRRCDARRSLRSLTTGGKAGTVIRNERRGQALAAESFCHKHDFLPGAEDLFRGRYYFPR